MSNSSGRFITIEGIDGAGKTCNLIWIKTLLEQAGNVVVCTREPGGTPIGEEIRDALLRSRSDDVEALSELMLIAAARIEHIAKLILPALKRGEWVLCDRFSDATYAYQGGGRGVDLTVISTLEDLLQGSLRPHLTILLDVPVALGQARARSRTLQDRFDKEAAMFFHRVRATYLARAAADPQRIRIIDASNSLVKVQSNIAQLISEFVTSQVLVQ